MWIFPARRGPGVATWRSLHRGDGSVIVRDPALGIALYGFTAQGARIAEAVEPSALERLLGTRLPVDVPAGWRRVSLGALSVRVPVRWPRHRLGERSGRGYVAPPNFCGFGYFPRPVADTGVGVDVYHCPMLDADTALRGSAAPGNGVWLESDGASQGLPPAVAPGTTVTSRRLHGVRIELEVPRMPLGTDALEVVIPSRHGDAVVVVGLGRSPRVAAEILSSIRLAP